MATRLPIPWFVIAVLIAATASGILIVGLATWAIYGNFVGAVHGSVLGIIAGVLLIPILGMTSPTLVARTVSIPLPRIRFGLQTLLAMVAISAIMLWCRLSAWPAWQRHRMLDDLRRGNESPIACHQAAAALVNCGTQAVPDLVACLTQGDSETCRWSIWILEKMAGDARSAVPALIELAKRPQSEQRKEAIAAVCVIALDATESLEMLAMLLDDSDEDIRNLVMQQLALLGPRATPILIQALRHRETSIRLKAVESLLFLRGDAVEAVSPLFEAWRHDPDSGVRDRARWALHELGPAALPYLCEQFRESGDAFVASWLASIITQLDPAAAGEFIPRLIGFLGDSDRSTRYRAAASLGRIGDRGIDAIREATECADKSIRAGANEAIDLLAAMDAAKSRQHRSSQLSGRETPSVP